MQTALCDHDDNFNRHPSTMGGILFYVYYLIEPSHPLPEIGIILSISYIRK